MRRMSPLAMVLVLGVAGPASADPSDYELVPFAKFTSASFIEDLRGKPIAVDCVFSSASSATGGGGLKALDLVARANHDNLVLKAIAAVHDELVEFAVAEPDG